MNRLPKRYRRKRGFTLVELLVVCFIIALLMNVALPFYISASTDAVKKTCRSNMQSIVNAAVAWRTKNRAINFTGMTVSALNGDLGSIPLCPAGGTYTIVYTGTVPDTNGNLQTVPANGIGISCSFGSHYGFIPGVMGQ